MHNSIYFCPFPLQPGTELQEVLKEKAFSEPRLIIFVNEQDMKNAQGFIIAEKQVLFEVDSFTLTDGLISLIASYYVFYVSYPKLSPATGVLLFIQEILLGQADVTTKKTSKYIGLINSVSS